MSTSGDPVCEAQTTSGLPDWVTDPNAVLDDDATWRYGRAPDYSQTRKMFEETKTTNHEIGSLAFIAENLVKNWEIEASFKMNLKDWRTVNPEKYQFAMNGAPAITGEEMLRLGTYNAVIAPNDFYSPNTSDFASSHKTFKRMMPRFAWEVTEVYSGPPKVVFKWRHWGVMKNDYVGFNDKGEKVTAKAHGGSIVIFGLTVALVDESMRIERLDTWFDPLDMFRQIAPQGIVTRVARKATPGEDLAAALDSIESPNIDTAPAAGKTDDSSTQSNVSQSEATKDVIGVDGASSSPNTRGLRKLVSNFSGAFGSLRTVMKSRTSSRETTPTSSSSGESYTLIKPSKTEASEQGMVPSVASQIKISTEDLAKSAGATGTCPFANGVVATGSAVNDLSPGQAQAMSPKDPATTLAHQEMGEVRTADLALLNQE